MRIMSLNAWGGRLHSRLISYLTEAKPDVICLQEVTETMEAGQEWLTYRDGVHALPQRANLFAEVSNALPDHAAVFCPAAQGVLWDGDVALPSRWGIATFVHRSLAIIGQIQGFIHKKYSPNGYGEHPRSRSAHAVRIYDPAADRIATVTHMHGLRDPAGKSDTPERRAQAHRLLAIAGQMTEPGDLAVICGDFNVEPGSETFELTAEAGFTDLVTDGGHLGTRTSRYTKPGRFADYMLVNDTDLVRGFRVVREPEVSDHCPLVLEV